VEGQVQGVGYRYFAQDRALELGLTGYAKNLFDGRVEVVAEGLPDRVAVFSKLMEKGPPFADVKRISVAEEPATGEFESFYVR